MEIYSMLRISPKQFLKSYVPILLSFISSKIITQTDLLMVSPLGEVSIAAFGVPARIMMIDIIIAFAIAPVISVLIASATDASEKRLLVDRSLSFSLFISIGLVVFGLWLYPILIEFSVKNVVVMELSTMAVFWLTIAIPFRLIQFVCSMIIYSTGKGNQLPPVLISVILLNVVFNWLFIYHFDYGFLGAYISTFVVSIIELVWSLFLIKEYIDIRRIITLPQLFWIKSIISNIGAEWGRLVSWQLAGFTVLFIFSMNSEWIDRQTAYAVAMEVQALLLIPFIAAMRCTAIVMAPYEKASGPELYKSIQNILWIGLLFLIPVIFLLFYFSFYVGVSFFHLNKESLHWWRPFIVTTALFLPIYYYKSLQMGIWQSRKKFNQIFLIDSLTQWLIIVPVVYIGLKTNNPWITWSGLPAAEAIMTLVLFLFRLKLYPIRFRVVNTVNTKY